MRRASSRAVFQLLAEDAVRVVEPGRDWDRPFPIKVGLDRGRLVDLDRPRICPASMRWLPRWLPRAVRVVGIVGVGQ